MTNNNADNVASVCDLDSGHEELVNIVNDLHESLVVIAERSPKIVNGRLKGYCFSETVFNGNRNMPFRERFRIYSNTYKD